MNTYVSWSTSELTLGGSEKYKLYTWPVLLICIVDKSLCEACLVSFRVFIFVLNIFNCIVFNIIYLENFSFIPVVQEA